MAETIAAPIGPRWQRVVLTLLGLYGLVLLAVSWAGEFVMPAIVLAAAVAVAFSAPGNRWHKLIVLSWLTMLLILAVASTAWD